MITQAPKGTKDLLPADSYRFQWVEAHMRRAAELACYREIRTPVFEHTELFSRGVGDATDLVRKEMYTFADKGDRSITLKPEGTAGAVRALIEARLYAQPLPCKMYYLAAPIFRYESPQSGRLREHHQFGMECFGSQEATADAEVIVVLLRMLEGMGLQNLALKLNSIGCPECRPAYLRALKDYLGKRLDRLCPQCRERFERSPLRVLDCKEPGCKALVKDAPDIRNTLCAGCAEHFSRLGSLLVEEGIAHQVDAQLVRGLDYYTKTVFEIIMRGQREGLALCGGGRYDGLVEQLGGPPTPAVGFGLGMERVLMELDAQGVEIPRPPQCEVYIASIGEETADPAFRLAGELRRAGLRADCDHMGRSLKAQFRHADRLGAGLVLIVGGDELSRGNVRLRDMATKEEAEIPLALVPQAVEERL